LTNRVPLQLPHRTGTRGAASPDDGVLHITRATLVELSKSGIDNILDILISLLESLSRPYETISAHPRHILLSEIYILAVAADCCAAKWSTVQQGPPRRRNNLDADGQGDDDQDDNQDDAVPSPPPLEHALVHRILDTLKKLLEPIPEDYGLPAQTLLDQVSQHNVTIPRFQPSQGDGTDSGNFDALLVELDTHVKVIVEYVTASTWNSAFDYFRGAVYSIRSSIVSPGGNDAPKTSLDGETAALVVVRLLSFFWVDAAKLRLVIQEICSSYLHFRRPYQHAVAVVIPLLITRWVDRYPREFVRLHVTRRRLDAAVDTLFDMAQRVSDNAKKKTLLYPLQTTLLFLLPDIFEVASNMKEGKSSSIAKKVTFLEGLRKSLRNGQETSAYCLVSLLRAARHFDVESDAAIVSYAMDVQDEVRDAVFRRTLSSTPSAESSHFDQDTMTAAFVSLAHLNLDSSLGTLVESCLAPSAPDVFKIAAVQGCCYFAQQTYALQYHELFEQVVPFMKARLEVGDTNN
jgi:neurofibromin 1